MRGKMDRIRTETGAGMWALINGIAIAQ